MAAGGPFQSVNCRCRKWLPEVGMLSPTDPVFVGYKISPKRISGMLIVSRQLLRQQTGPELDRILINDLLCNWRAIWINAPCTAANQPTGLIVCPGYRRTSRLISLICTPQILDPVAGAKASRRPLCVSIATGSRRSKTQKLFRFGHFGIPFL